MRIIAHRGNLNGKSQDENSPSQIDMCLEANFDCEVDVWVQEKNIWLGHDFGQYAVGLDWLLSRRFRLWIHCKNLDSIEFFSLLSERQLNYFWHQNDSYTLTSLNFIWVLPGSPLIPGSIAVLPEVWEDEDLKENLNNCGGICTDFPIQYRNTLSI